MRCTNLFAEVAAGAGGGDFGAGTVWQFRGSTGSLTNSEGGGGGIREVSALNEEGSCVGLLRSGASSFASVVLGLDDEGECACSPLDCHH